MKKISLKKVKDEKKFAYVVCDVIGILLSMVVGYFALVELTNVVNIQTAWYHDLLAWSGIFDDVQAAIVAWAIILVASFIVMGYRLHKLNSLFKTPKSKGEARIIELSGEAK